MAAPRAPESIYNLLPRLEERPVKPPRYVSTFRPSVKHEIEKSKAQWKTMGPAKVEVPSPKNFLQKHSKEPKLPERKKEQDSRKMPALSVPRKTDHPLMGIQSKKNFINANAVAAIMGLAKKPQPIYVDRRQGDKHLLETSGLVPKYVKKKDYGIIPKYVTQRNKEIKRAQKEHEAYVLESLRKRAMKRLSDEERSSLLQGLKKNWEEVHHEFQGLSVYIDTIPKKMHKEKLESQMKQLEHDIGVIEKHEVIYIANE
ncbi:enkurin isoform X1 [Apteryx rowi]|uniref:enkurin isoform X1 n=2 Tax=Apteryx rowi TaxID=308060 RepID=UPI000E1DB315|nr:enkurin isoform X1 [Apteryx rowi]XP_025921554.1 enkurin isoform X1 [Apteryx rowi]